MCIHRHAETGGNESRCWGRLPKRALAACTPDSPATSLYPLPDVYHDHLSESPTVVKIDPTKIVVPPPVPAQKTDYGDIMPRAAWTTSPLRLKEGVPMNGVTRITIHHSGDGKPFLGESTTDVIRHLQVVQQGHLQRGMIDIAYHFAIDRTGRVWQLRWLQYEGQHVRNSANGTRNNEHNIGVVCLGGFRPQVVTMVQRDRLLSLVKMLREPLHARPRNGTDHLHARRIG